jgi:hypothetical protein
VKVKDLVLLLQVVDQEMEVYSMGSTKPYPVEYLHLKSMAYCNGTNDELLKDVRAVLLADISFD